MEGPSTFEQKQPSLEFFASLTYQDINDTLLHQLSAFNAMPLDKTEEFINKILDYVKNLVQQKDIVGAEKLCHQFLADSKREREIKLWQLMPLSHVQLYYKLGKIYLNVGYCELAQPYFTRALLILDTYEEFAEQQKNSDKEIKLSEDGQASSKLRSKIERHLTLLEIGAFSEQVQVLPWAYTQESVKLLKRKDIEEIYTQLQPLLDGLALAGNRKKLNEIYSNMELVHKHYLNDIFLNELNEHPSYYHPATVENYLEKLKIWRSHQQNNLTRNCYLRIKDLFGQGIIEYDNKEKQNDDLKKLEELMQVNDNSLEQNKFTYQPLWQQQRKELKALRKNFQVDLVSKKHTHAHNQNDYTQSIKKLIAAALQKFVNFLGIPPCSFHLGGIGSISQGMGPYSDVEVFLLINDERFKCHPYFQALITLLDFHLKNLGDPWIINGEHKEFVGLHIDKDCLKELKNEKPTFINTSNDLAEWVKNEFKTETYSHHAYALMRPVSLYAYSKAAKSDEAKLLSTYQDKLYFGLDHELIALHYLVQHQEAYQKIYLQMESNKAYGVCNLKTAYLSPLRFLCLDLALYFNLKNSDGKLSTDSYQIINCIPEEHIRNLLTLIPSAFACLNQLRDEMQFLRGHQPDEVKLPSYFNPTSKKSGLHPASVSYKLLPVVDKTLEGMLEVIAQDILNMYGLVVDSLTQNERNLITGTKSYPAKNNPTRPNKPTIHSLPEGKSDLSSKPIFELLVTQINFEKSQKSELKQKERLATKRTQEEQQGRKQTIFHEESKPVAVLSNDHKVTQASSLFQQPKGDINMQDNNQEKTQEKLKKTKKPETYNISGNPKSFINTGTVGGDVFMNIQGKVHKGKITKTTIYNNYQPSHAKQESLTDQFKRQLGREFLGKNYVITLYPSAKAIEIKLTLGNLSLDDKGLEEFGTILLTTLSLKQVNSLAHEEKLIIKADEEQQNKIIKLMEEAGFNLEIIGERRVNSFGK